MQNFIVFIDEETKTRNENPDRLEALYDISLKGGKMCLNRFCIDEDAAFELSGVHYLKSVEIGLSYDINKNTKKGRENSLVWS